jgi:AcrR family transcriptional regulator
VNDVVHSEDRAIRHADRKVELLEAAADYVLAHGLAGLAIRPLAAALGMSHRTLLYYFGTKEKLVLAVLEVIRDRDKRRIVEHLARARADSAIALFRAAWADFSAPERLPYIRFFHEVVALGLDDPSYQVWMQATFESRITMIAAVLAAIGLPPTRTRRAAVLITAAVRGLQLHLLTTGDRAATDAAFEELLSGLEARLPR